MNFQVRLYTSGGVVLPEEVDELVAYRRKQDGGEAYALFSTPFHARRALHEYVAAVPSIVKGGEIIKVDNAGHYRTVYHLTPNA